MRNNNNRFAQALVSHYPQLSPQLQLAAQYILENPDDVALLSMRALAKKAGVQPVTVSRLVRSIGCDSYDALREAYQAHVRGRESDYAQRLQAIRQRGQSGEAALLQEMLRQEQANLDRLLDSQMDVLAEAAALLERSRRIYVLGLRGAYSVAYLFHYCYQMFDENSVLLEGAGGVFADQLRHINSDDCLLAISAAPYSRAVVQACELARDVQADIVAITDSQVSPLALMANHSIVCETTTSSFYQSFGSAMAASQCLISLLVTHAGDEAVDALRNSEAQLEKMGAYW